MVWLLSFLSCCLPVFPVFLSCSQLLPVFHRGICSEYCGGVSSHDSGSSSFSSFRSCLLLLIWLWLPFFFLPQQFLLSCAVAFLSLFIHHLRGAFCAGLGSVPDLFCYLVLLFPALGRFGAVTCGPLFH